MAQDLEAGTPVVVLLDGVEFHLDAEDVELRVKSQSGFAVSRDGAYVVALDLDLDDGLRRRGTVRELVRQVQDLRKERGLDVSDHIVLSLAGIDLSDDERSLVGREVLADAIEDGSLADGGASLDLDDGVGVTAWLRRVG